MPLVNIKFGIRTIVYCRTSFLRQITEACKIQEVRRRHVLLNSRAEYNRSAVPRLITKLGETEYEKFGKEKMMEKRQDEVVEEKIRKLRKANNVERRPQDHNVENKRRKLENSEYEEQKGCWGRPGEKKPEKRAGKKKNPNPKIKR